MLNQTLGWLRRYSHSKNAFDPLDFQLHEEMPFYTLFREFIEFLLISTWLDFIAEDTKWIILLLYKKGEEIYLNIWLNYYLYTKLVLQKWS